MVDTVQIKRGPKSGLPVLRDGEFGLCKDTKELFIGCDGENLWVNQGGGDSGADFTTDATLTLENGVLRVNTASKVEADNTLPVTSAAVNVTVGNIEVLLQTI